MGVASLIGVALSVLLGATMQRVAGLGLSLVSSPLLVMVAGPVEGVLLANTLNLVTGLLVLAETWRQVDLRKVSVLVVPALVAVPVGGYVARHLPAPDLMIAIGGLVIAALSAVRLLRRSGLFAGTPGALVAGALSGFMNATAGVAGPMITLYAIGSGWPQRTFVGSAQLFFVMLNAASILVKGLPRVGWTTFGVAFAALPVGLVAGHFLACRVSPGRARKVAMALAVAGSAGTLVKGLLLALG